MSELVCTQHDPMVTKDCRWCNYFQRRADFKFKCRWCDSEEPHCHACMYSGLCQALRSALPRDLIDMVHSHCMSRHVTKVPGAAGDSEDFRVHPKKLDLGTGDYFNPFLVDHLLAGAALTSVHVSVDFYTPKHSRFRGFLVDVVFSAGEEAVLTVSMERNTLMFTDICDTGFEDLVNEYVVTRGLAVTSSVVGAEGCVPIDPVVKNGLVEFPRIN